MNYYGYDIYCESDLTHHGIKGQKWGVRRYQNNDGTLTAAGKKRYSWLQDKLGFDERDRMISAKAETSWKKRSLIEADRLENKARTAYDESVANLKKTTNTNQKIRDERTKSFLNANRIGFDFAISDEAKKAGAAYDEDRWRELNNSYALAKMDAEYLDGLLEVSNKEVDEALYNKQIAKGELERAEQLKKQAADKYKLGLEVAKKTEKEYANTPLAKFVSFRASMVEKGKKFISRIFGKR